MTAQPPATDLIRRAKFRAPRLAPHLVSRPRLLLRLDEGAWRKLTLVCAPPGSGKTTLVAAWAAQAARPAAWLALDEADNAPARFLGLLASASQAAFGGAGQAAAAMLDSPTPLDPAAVVDCLLNELEALAAPSLLVLDDYHVIHNETIHAAVNALVEHLPERLHLVIASREDPPLALARLRARGELNEVRGKDLRFTQDEAEDFLARAGLALTPEQAAALEARTEGWAAGLQLAALSLRDRPDATAFVRAFTGSNRYVLDYLVEEVLRAQPPEAQSFLLRTSILERLSSPLCAALVDTSESSAQAALERLERANLFLIPLDDERRWFRYHTLFADLLRFRLAQEQPAALPELHRRAAGWLEKREMGMEAVPHWLAAGEASRAGALAQSVGEVLLSRGQVNALIGWLDTLPPALYAASPRLHLIYAFAMLTVGQFNALAPRLDAAESGLKSLADQGRIPRDGFFSETLAEIAGTRALLASIYGNLPEVIRLSNEALAGLVRNQPMRASLLIGLGVAYRITGDSRRAADALGESAALTRGTRDQSVFITSLCNQGDVLLERGELALAESCYREALESGELVEGASSGIPNTCMAYGGLSELAYARWEIDEAARLVRLALEAGEPWGNPDIRLANLSRLVRCYEAGGSAEAESVYRQMEQAAQDPNVNPFVGSMLPVMRALRYLHSGEVAKAWEWVSAHPVPPGAGYLQGAQALAEAEVRLAWAAHTGDTGYAQQALDLLDSTRPVFEAGEWGMRVLQADALRVLALSALGRHAESAALLESLLEHAQPEGHVSLFAERGEPMAALLRRAHHPYARAVLAHFPSSLPPAALQTSPDMPGLLSPREVEVLRLAAQGLSNPAIAARLVLSPGTVKRHLHNILTKLNTETRAEAVAQAKRLGLL